ncbi:hypothetical protein ACET3Z_023252 [Daucus carota]
MDLKFRFSWLRDYYRLMCIKIHYIPTSKNGSYKPPPTTLPWPMREGHVAATTPLDPCQRPINMRRKREKGRRSSSSGSRVISIEGLLFISQVRRFKIMRMSSILENLCTVMLYLLQRS